VLAERTIEADLRHVEKFRGRVDLVELRVDHLDDREKGTAGRLPGLVGIPVILTLRRGRDGGKFDGPEAERVALLHRLAGGCFSYVDLEEDLRAASLETRIAESGARIIRSLHDFSGIPPSFLSRIHGLARRPGEIPKAAVTPRSSAELAGLLEVFGALPASERLLLGMGEIGFPTRVLAAKLGSSWCYASPTDNAVAPGQVTPVTLEDVYRFRAIGPSTSVYGVIGNPVMHSRSPLIHNAGFGALGIDSVYLPFHVPDLEGFWKVADILGMRGISVTVPHKQAVLGPAVRADAAARAVGACNTLTREGEGGSWSGTNTDGEGFLQPLRAVFGGEIPAGLGATVIGAGGAARSVVSALIGSGARVLVLNRTREKAQRLAEAFAAKWGGIDQGGMETAAGFSDLVVQTTSAGMTPDEDGDPAPGLDFSGREIVYELVYSPQQTAFLRRARGAGCRVVYGRQMLLAQAMRQFLLFTGEEYPPELRDRLQQSFD
jgi:3-dehydroquinate dehydratase/shikimate dehydrogenase